jgi:transposase
MHRYAILWVRVKRACLEGSPCAIPYRPFVNMKLPSRSDCKVNMMAIGSLVCRCSTCWSRSRAQDRQDVARLLGIHRNTIGRWLARYAAGGLDALLATYVPPGKPVSLAPEVLASLENALHRPEGFASYEALRQWVRRTHGVEVKYKTLYSLVRVRFQAKLKVARPSHTKKA